VVGGYEAVVSGIYLEGLAVDCDRSIVWYSDVIAGGVHGLGQCRSPMVCNPERMWTGG